MSPSRPTSLRCGRSSVLCALRDHLGKADAYITAVEELIELPALDRGDEDEARRRNHVAHLIESTKLAVRAALGAGNELEADERGS